MAGSQLALRCLLVPCTPHTAPTLGSGQDTGSPLSGAWLEVFLAQGLFSQEQAAPPYCGRHQLLQGRASEVWIKESWAGVDPDLAATGETQKAEQGLGKAREGPWFWLGGELVMRWSCLKGQLFAFLEPEV